MTYIVRQTMRYPAWDEKNGFTYEVIADSKSEAIARARRQARDCGHFGQSSFKALEAK